MSGRWLPSRALLVPKSVCDHYPALSLLTWPRLLLHCGCGVSLAAKSLAPHAALHHYFRRQTPWLVADSLLGRLTPGTPPTLPRRQVPAAATVPCCCLSPGACLVSHPLHPSAASLHAPTASLITLLRASASYSVNPCTSLLLIWSPSCTPFIHNCDSTPRIL